MMRMLDKKLIVLVLCLLVFIPAKIVFAIGIAPAEKTVILTENQPGSVFFSVSQGDAPAVTFTMSADATWLEIDPVTFDVDSMSSKYIEVKISPLAIGNYTASIKASSTPIGSTVKIIQSITATLHVLVYPIELPPETKALLKKQAEEAIKRAQDMINEARRIGVDTNDAEILVANALQEFSNENYPEAIQYADSAYNLALSLYNNALREAEAPLIPIQTALLIIILGATAVILVIVFEIYKIMKHRKTRGLPIAKGITCPKCKSPMAVAYQGNLVIGYVCRKCRHTEIKEKTHG